MFKTCKFFRTDFLLLVFLSFFMWTSNACRQPKDSALKIKTAVSGTVPKQTNTTSDYFPEGYIHPNAKRVMNEDFYWSPIEETGPFGSDDGADTYGGFNAWRIVHKSENPKEFLIKHIAEWGYPEFDLFETRIEKLLPYTRQSSLGYRFLSGIDAAIVAIAFGQLRMEGTIHKELTKLARLSIERELIPEFLTLWDEPYRDVRKTQLKKMLEVLNQVKLMPGK